jgi:dUTPase
MIFIQRHDYLEAIMSILHTMATNSSLCTISVRRLSEDAKMPQYNGSDGYYLFAAKSTRIRPQETGCFCTDLTFEFPGDCHDIVEVRIDSKAPSNLSFVSRFYEDSDPDKLGNYSIELFNHSNNGITVAKGDRIAKMIIVKRATYPMVEASMPNIVSTVAVKTVNDAEVDTRKKETKVALGYDPGAATRGWRTPLPVDPYAGMDWGQECREREIRSNGYGWD